MGVPDRFAIEYLQRALELIGVLEAPARVTVQANEEQERRYA